MIEFIPQSLEEAATFQDLLVRECLLRDIDMVDFTREQMRAKIQTTLTHKSHLRNLVLHLDQCTLDEGMCFVLLQWIPCILHMESRFGLKIFYMLLSEGLSHVKRWTNTSFVYSKFAQGERSRFCK